MCLRTTVKCFDTIKAEKVTEQKTANIPTEMLGKSGARQQRSTVLCRDYREGESNQRVP